jgi:hypothetical protein
MDSKKPGNKIGEGGRGVLVIAGEDDRNLFNNGYFGAYEIGQT